MNKYGKMPILFEKKIKKDTRITHARSAGSNDAPTQFCCRRLCALTIQKVHEFSISCNFFAFLGRCVVSACVDIERLAVQYVFGARHTALALVGNVVV